MIFNSLFSLIETDTEGVYKFICRLFYENNFDLSIDDRLYIFAVIRKLKDCKEKDCSHFFGLFENRKYLLKILNRFSPGNKYSFLVDNSDVNPDTVDKKLNNIIKDYINIFGINNIN